MAPMIAKRNVMNLISRYRRKAAVSFLLSHRPKRRETDIKQGGASFSSFLGSWQFWLACFSGLVYILGYYRALLLFSALEVYITPTEVYDLLSLFTWGITTILAALPVAILLTMLGFGLSKILGYRKLWSYLVVGLLLLMINRILFNSLPWLTQYNRVGFIFVPSRFFYWNHDTDIYAYRAWIALVLTLVVLCAYLYFHFKNQYLLPAYLITLVVWVFLLTSTQYFDFYSVRGGAAINSVSQYPGMNGLLLTKNRVSFYGENLPEYGENAFGTWGLLLSRHSGEYYFVPWIVANAYEAGAVGESVAEKYGNILIIPDQYVISFLTRFPEKFDFYGFSAP